MLTAIDLFAGIGGFSFAMHGVFRTIVYVESDDGCQKVLKKNMQRGLLDVAPVTSDVREFCTERSMEPPGVGAAHIVYAGFPCTDLSQLGPRTGLNGHRSGLFYEVVRIVATVRPCLVFLENVPNIVQNGLSDVCAQMKTLGYSVNWTIVSAAQTGAPHLRRRWWGLCTRSTCKIPRAVRPSTQGWQEQQRRWGAPFAPHQRSSPRTKDNTTRVQILGNAVVPSVASSAFWHLQDPERYSLPNMCNFVDIRVLPPQMGPHNASTSVVSKPFVSRLWPTPTFSSVVEGPARVFTARQKTKLSMIVKHSEDASPFLGSPSAAFVEYLMGYPEGYTDIHSGLLKDVNVDAGAAS